MASSDTAMLRKGWTLSPTSRISLGLVSMLMGLLMVLDLALKVLPSQRGMEMALREQVGLHLAVQIKAMLNDGRSPEAMQQSMTELVEQSGDILSMGVRKQDGQLVAQTRGHEAQWVSPGIGSSTLSAVIVPLNAEAGKWGQLEVAYRSPWPDNLTGWVMQPNVQMVAILCVTSFIAFYLYLRRVLQHLDPSKAIPERVRMAFDTLTEGLLVLDSQGQVIMANEAFRTFHPKAGGVLIGKVIGDLHWLTEGLRLPAGAPPPWARAMDSTEPILGVELDLGTPEDPRRALLNCAAIRDAGGNPRGCLLTLDDVTALDRVNSQLRLALQDLGQSRDQVQRQNEELQLLANCDPMTGCFNRRAFFARAEPMLTDALASGAGLSCLMTDIDKFKSFNDTYGHALGDEVIQQVARILKSAVRSQDVLCRFGGEEFCMFLPGLDHHGAAKVAERIRHAIESEAGPSITTIPGLRITASFGVAQLGAGGAVTAEALIDRADQGLYKAKEGGRNQVQCIDW